MRLLKAALLIAAALIPAIAGAAVRQAFQPGGKTVLVSATTTAATVTLQGAGGSLLVYNSCIGSRAYRRYRQHGDHASGRDTRKPRRSSVNLCAVGDWRLRVDRIGQGR